MASVLKVEGPKEGYLRVKKVEDVRPSHVPRHIRDALMTREFEAVANREGAVGLFRILMPANCPFLIADRFRLVFGARGQPFAIIATRLTIVAGGAGASGQFQVDANKVQGGGDGTLMDIANEEKLVGGVTDRSKEGSSSRVAEEAPTRGAMAGGVLALAAGKRESGVPSSASGVKVGLRASTTQGATESDASSEGPPNQRWL